MKCYINGNDYLLLLIIIYLHHRVTRKATDSEYMGDGESEDEEDEGAWVREELRVLRKKEKEEKKEIKALLRLELEKNENEAKRLAIEQHEVFKIKKLHRKRIRPEEIIETLETHKTNSHHKTEDKLENVKSMKDLYQLKPKEDKVEARKRKQTMKLLGDELPKEGKRGETMKEQFGNMETKIVEKKTKKATLKDSKIRKAELGILKENKHKDQPVEKMEAEKVRKEKKRQHFKDQQPEKADVEKVIAKEDKYQTPEIIEPEKVNKTKAHIDDKEGNAVTVDKSKQFGEIIRGNEKKGKKNFFRRRFGKIKLKDKNSGKVEAEEVKVKPSVKRKRVKVKPSVEPKRVKVEPGVKTKEVEVKESVKPKEVNEDQANPNITTQDPKTFKTGFLGFFRNILKTGENVKTKEKPINQERPINQAEAAKVGKVKSTKKEEIPKKVQMTGRNIVRTRRGKRR